jgi:restriction system protein
MVTPQHLVDVMATAEGPLHYKDITTRVLQSGVWSTKSQTPWAAVNNVLNSNPQIFSKGSRGYYELASQVKPTPVSETAEPPPQSMTYLEAAEKVLKDHADSSGMSYKKIAQIAVESGYISPSAASPEANLNAQISTDIKKRASRGEPPRFWRPSRGLIALSRTERPTLQRQVDDQNAQVRRELKKRLQSMEPFEFEKLILAFLTTLGYKDTEVTSQSHDGGIDVRGTLVVADVIETRMAVQVKRWTQNIQRPVVQQVRGSLGVHDQGLIITTGGFSNGARDEAEKPNTVRVALMDGNVLVNQLIEHGIGVEKTSITILDLSSDAIDISTG